MEIRLSVRGLVEFVLRTGDIDNRIHQGSPDAMQEGGRIHRMIQKSMGPDYHAEVPLLYEKSYEKYDLIVEGRADGILDRFMDEPLSTLEMGQSSFLPAERYAPMVDEYEREFVLGRSFINPNFEHRLGTQMFKLNKLITFFYY